MPPVKLFISSEFKRDGTYSNFSFQLPRPVDVGKQYRAMVDQIHIPHVFPTITANNRALYFEEVYDEIKTACLRHGSARCCSMRATIVEINWPRSCRAKCRLARTSRAPRTR